MALTKHKWKNASGETVVSDDWYYRFRHKGKTYFASTGSGNKTVAQRIEDKRKREVIEQVELGVAGSITTKQALEKYLGSKKSNSEHHNLLTYVTKLLGSKFDKRAQKDVRIFGLDGSKSFDKLTTADLQQLVMNRRLEGNQDTTILHELATFSQTVKLIAKLGLAVPKIDIAAIKRENKVRPSKGKLRFLSLDEERALLAELGGDDYDFVLTLLDTAARHTEIAKLKWEAVDMKRKQISLYRFKVGNESMLPMTDRLHAMLKRRSEAKREDQVYVFESVEGEHRGYSNSAFNRACKRAGIKDCTFHTLRHSAASKCAQAGMSLYEIQALLGHSSPQMSAKYAHLIPNASLRKAVDVFNKAA